MRRLKAFLTAFVLALAICGGTTVYLSNPERNSLYPVDSSYRYLISKDKFDDPDFILANTDENTIVVMGSSEFSTGFIPSHPGNNFYGKGYNLDMMLIGQGYYQSLWHGICAGAISQDLENKKVVIIVSPQWFERGGMSPDAFRSFYSEEMMQEFLENPEISDETKKSVVARSQQLLNGTRNLDQMVSSDPIDKINFIAHDIISDIKRYRRTIKSVGVVETKEVPAKDIRDIDWDALLEQAQLDGEADCTNNDYGIYNGYFKRYCKDIPAGYSKNADYTVSPEYGDLELFFQICKETGLEPMVVSIPVNGPWADYTEIPEAMRQTYYQNIRDICAKHDVKCADFSQSEYEKYFLCDVMHVGYRGWIHIEKAICDFATED